MAPVLRGPFSRDLALKLAEKLEVIRSKPAMGNYFK